MKKLLFTATIGCLASSCIGTTTKTLNPDKEITYCMRQINRALLGLQQENGSYDYTMQPRNIVQKQQVWNCRKATAQEWCSGFWPGILWMGYSATHDSLIRQQAEGFTSSLSSLIQQPVYDHDL